MDKDSYGAFSRVGNSVLQVNQMLGVTPTPTPGYGDHVKRGAGVTTSADSRITRYGAVRDATPGQPEEKTTHTPGAD